MIDNVVIITIDECKASALSGYGNKYTHTPTSELMKSEGAQINSAFTCHPKCVPSRACLLTGRYSHSEGHRTLPGFEIRKNEYNLASFLKSEGYRTAMFGKNHTIEPSILSDVFDNVSSVPKINKKNVVTAEGIPKNSPMWRAHYRGSYKNYFDSEPADIHHISEAKSFLRENKDNKFFMLCNFNMPHPVYLEMEGYIEEIKVLDPPLAPVERLTEAPDTLRWYRKAYDLEMLTSEQWKKIQNAYYSMVSYIDSNVKQLIDEIKNLGLIDNTLIVYTSDHGDFGSEHGCSEKYDTMFYDCLINIPLYFMAPGLRQGEIDGMVENIDILPTVLEALGYSVPGHIHGKSIWNALNSYGNIDKKYVFCEGGIENWGIENAPFYDSDECIRMKPDYYWKQVAAYDYKKSMQRSKMIRSENYKLVYRQDGTKEFYNLNEDEYEINDLSDVPKYESIILIMMEELLKWCIYTETDYPHIDKLFA